MKYMIALRIHMKKHEAGLGRWLGERSLYLTQVILLRRLSSPQRKKLGAQRDPIEGLQSIMIALLILIMIGRKFRSPTPRQIAVRNEKD